MYISAASKVGGDLGISLSKICGRNITITRATVPEGNTEADRWRVQGIIELS